MFAGASSHGTIAVPSGSVGALGVGATDVDALAVVLAFPAGVLVGVTGSLAGAASLAGAGSGVDRGAQPNANPLTSTTTRAFTDRLPAP
jgi:hypothetical protein